MSNIVPPSPLATRLALLQQQVGIGDWGLGIRERCQSPIPHPPSPILMAASKGQSATVIEEAIGLGVTHFGENRVQEAQAKWPALKAKYPHVTLHLIGSLQTNKVKEAVGLFDVIQTVDRQKLADAVRQRIEELENWGTGEKSASPVPQFPSSPVRSFFIQVNTGEEPQKGGVAPRDLEKLVIYMREQAGLKLVGLMCVPPAEDNPAPHFALMQKLSREFDLKELSMGMSGDFQTAIRFGATHIRVGTALFGPRPAN